MAEQLGESVAYARVDDAGVAATGFPKTLTVVFRVDNASRKDYEDGQADMQIGVMDVRVSDLGSDPQIRFDSVTRDDGTEWIIEDVRSIAAGLARCECARYVSVEKSRRAYRIRR